MEIAAKRLLPIVYDELRGIAGRIFKSQRATEKSIQPTILVHGVFMKLAQNTDIDWKSGSHFFAVAAKATRELLVVDARRQDAAKRGGGWLELGCAPDWKIRASKKITTATDHL